MYKLIKKIPAYVACKLDPVKYARKIGVRVGGNCKFHGVDVGTFGSEPYLISIGDHVEITAKVKFFAHDGGVWVFRGNEPEIDVFKPIKIGSNVFLGRSSIILPGAVIEDDVVVGAGSVVSGRLQSGFVFAGVPARKIKALDDYRKKIEPFCFRTKLMSRDEKRKKLEDFFDLS